MSDNVYVVRSKTGQIKSVVTGGRQIAYGSKAYRSLSSSTRQTVERSGGGGQVSSGGGGTAPYVAGQPTEWELLASAPYTPAPPEQLLPPEPRTPTITRVSLKKSYAATPQELLASRMEGLATPKTAEEAQEAIIRKGIAEGTIRRISTPEGKEGYVLPSGKVTAYKSRAISAVRGAAEFTAPAYTVEGFQQRMKNVKSTLQASLGKGKVVADVRQPIVKAVLEDVSNRPWEAALTVTGIGYFGAGLTKIPAAARAARGAYAATRVAGRGAVSAGRQAYLAATPIRAVGAAERAARFAQIGSATYGIGYATPQLAKQVGYATTTATQRAVAKKYDVNRAAAAGFAAEQEALSKSAFNLPIVGGVPLKRAAYEISPLLVSDKAAYKSAVQAELKAQGATGKELATATSYVMRQRTAAATGETASLLFVSAGAERMGRVGTALASASIVGKMTAKTAAKKITMKAIKPLAFAGFTEGFVQERAQQTAREQQPSFKEAAKMGAFGAVSAVAIGAPIIYTSITKAKAGKVLEVGANILDPYEYFGDKLADVGQSVQKRLAGRAPPVISISAPMSKKQTMVGVNIAPPSSRPSVSIPPKGARATTITKTKGKGISPTSIFVNLPTMTKMPSTTKQPTTTRTRTQSIIGVPVPPITPTPSYTPTETIIDTITDTTEETRQNINTETNTFIETVNVAPTTATPFPRYIPPILPFGFDTGMGFGGAGRGAKRKTFVDELTSSQNALTKLLGGGAGGLRISSKRYTTKKKKAKR